MAIEGGDVKETLEDVRKKDEGKMTVNYKAQQSKMMKFNNFLDKEAYAMLKRQRLGLYPCPKDSRGRTIFWYYSWPIRAILFCTVPNPKTQRKYYVLSFLLCIVWIGTVTYFIFFMLIVICKY